MSDFDEIKLFCFTFESLYYKIKLGGHNGKENHRDDS